ncbi:class I SAM-dependent RNA methyltransferase [Eilatimonas milleporae]|uniref:23S rRNA m(5)U-1939 methyltransferase n=1 Tax=Eilatimonas milleporae TaxID=911205 RepID=A0A3M0CGD7_9PROT|nr:class I SAM-dependent RNA methyltransferase [Eilatimonas milleporae]RMB08402.1 23S rRNA m(5)U-1939 methyltransferase [Eilatimonas milleporae]
MTLTIETLGGRGDGIAAHRLEDGTPVSVFVPGTMPGDRADVRLGAHRRFGVEGSLVRLVMPSPDRRRPPCAVFGMCGGCQLQFLDDTCYAAFLADRVRDTLQHQGISGVPVRAAAVSPPASRRRISLKAEGRDEGVRLGFNARGSHRLVDITACPVARDSLVALFPGLRDTLAVLLAGRGRAGIILTATDSGMDVLLDMDRAATLQDRDILTDWAGTNDIAALHWRDRGLMDPILIRRQPVMRFDGVPSALPPGGFLQATAEGERALRDAVLSAVEGSRRIVDLFAGIGTFSLPLARGRAVLAVEGDGAAVTALRGAAGAAASTHRLTVEHRDLFRRPLTADVLARFDAVVLDPPRAGAAAQVAELSAGTVPRVVSVSCNPATFARDARILIDSGYHLHWVQPVGQFLWSSHVELVGLFLR